MLYIMESYKGLTWLIPSILVAYYILQLVGRALRKKALQRQTALVELAILGKPREHNGKIKGTAVIAGGR